MDTRVSISVSIPEDSLTGEAFAYVSQWEGTKLTHNALVWQSDVFLSRMDPEQSVYPYAIAALRSMTDQAIADLMVHFAAGEVLLMHEVHFDK